MKKNVLRIVSALAIFALLALVFTIGVTRQNQNAHAASASKQPVSVLHQHPRVRNPNAVLSLYTCTGAVHGNMVINATESVTNDADSGQTNYWALDQYKRTIKVWNVGSDSWCAVVSYKGTFQAQAGQQSPGTSSNPPSGGILSGYETGPMNGAIEDLITGPLDVSNPSMWPLTGKVNGGTPVDYNCTGFTPGTFNITCPGGSDPDWVAAYFDQSAPNYTFTTTAYSFKYVGHNGPGSAHPGASDGVWVDANTGDSGDILDTSNPK